MSDYWNAVKHITLPVKLVDGRWELLYGGDTGIREGEYAELRTALSNIEDEKIRHSLTQTATVRVLPPGCSLWVALHDRSVARRQGPPVAEVADEPLGTNRWEVITLGTRESKPVAPGLEQRDPIDVAGTPEDAGGLWIRQRGVDRTDLLCKSVLMPTGFGPPTASSLNHACTLLSERYESHRNSHTHNVYRHVFFHQPDGKVFKWLPLDMLRNGVVAQAESRIIADAWRELENRLGFRPIALEPARRSRRKG